MTDDRTAEERAAIRKAGRQARTWKLTLAYDGGPYAGWQVQPGLTTVQGVLAKALARITGEQVLPQGSGRTDTGVHSLAQVASFKLCAAIAPENMQRALNQRLPASIRVLAAEVAPDAFHARHSAQSKLYEYRIWRGEICPPWLAPYVFAYPWPLRLEAMQEAARAVIGEHDFSSFAAREPDTTMRHAPDTDAPLEVMSSRADLALHAPHSVRRVLSSAWEERAPDLLCYQVRGTGFLHHMVRNLVGTFLAAGRGQIEAGSIPSILDARRRSAAGSTAPARGLFLHSVEY